MAEEALGPKQLNYHPFPLSTTQSSRTTRLLRVLPGSGTDPIQCDLEVIDLDIAPPFEALSYVWGTPLPPGYITIRGQTKSVTPNLGAALRRLRLRDRERVVWIDALCINQEDLDERSHQVLLMKDVFSLAWRVVIWLGEDDEGLAAEAIDIIKKIGEYCCMELGATLENLNFNRLDQLEAEEFDSPNKIGLRDIPTYDWEQEDDTLASNTSSKWKAVHWLYSRPWFTRIWIIQEVAFSPAVMYIGGYQVGWSEVVAAAHWLSRKQYTTNPNEEQYYHRVWENSLAASRPGVPFGTHFVSILTFQASNPRDHVYALLGLSDQPSREHVLLQPDYTKSVSHVYGDAIRQIFQEAPDISPLTSIFAKIDVAAFEPDDQYPSWIPRYDKKVFDREELEFQTQSIPWNACGNKLIHLAEMKNKDVISLQGVKVARIKHVSHILHERAQHFGTIKILWERTAQKIVAHTGPDSLQEAFVQTIQAGRTRMSDKTAEENSYSALDLELYLIMMESGGVFSQEALDFVDLHLDHFRDSDSALQAVRGLIYTYRRMAFFITSTGHLGVGATIAQPGDVVCVLFGGNLPYLIRPVGSQYRFLGQCYVHGFMYGAVIQVLERGFLNEEWIDLC